MIHCRIGPLVSGGVALDKNELVIAIAEKAGISKAEASAALNAALNEISNTLKNGGEVRLQGFGAFSASQRKARKGRNPATGANLEIPATSVPKFKPGKALKDALNADDGWGGPRKRK